MEKRNEKVIIRDANLTKVLSILTNIEENELCCKDIHYITHQFVRECNLRDYDDEMIIFCQRSDLCTDCEDPAVFCMEDAGYGDESIRQEYIDYLMPNYTKDNIVFALEGIEWYGVYVLDANSYALKEFYILPALGGISKFEHLQKKMIHIVNPTKEFENTLAHVPGTTITLGVLGDIANSLIRRYNMKKRW